MYWILKLPKTWLFFYLMVIIKAWYGKKIKSQSIWWVRSTILWGKINCHADFFVLFYPKLHFLSLNLENLPFNWFYASLQYFKFISFIPLLEFLFTIPSFLIWLVYQERYTKSLYVTHLCLTEGSKLCTAGEPGLDFHLRMQSCQFCFYFYDTDKIALVNILFKRNRMGDLCSIF